MQYSMLFSEVVDSSMLYILLPCWLTIGYGNGSFFSS